MSNRLELLRALSAAGLLVDSLESGRLIRCKTTEDKGLQKSGWYRLFDDADLTTCVYGDWRTGLQNTWIGGSKPTAEQRTIAKRLIEQAKQERQQEQAKQWAKNRIKLVSLWDEAAPITDTDPAGQYLMNRGLSVPATGVLRFHAGLDYWHDGECLGRFPAMLAAVTSPAGQLITIHRTFLTSQGQKAPVPTVKKLCSPAGPMTGGSIKIGIAVIRPDGRLGLCVAEGIETSLAASILCGVPCWPCVSANGLAGFVPPPEVHNIYVFADNDANQTGQRAASQLAERLTKQGRTVRIYTPPIAGNDWLDELNSMGATV